jgi:hypothetical protein
MTSGTAHLYRQERIDANLSTTGQSTGATPTGRGFPDAFEERKPTVVVLVVPPQPLHGTAKVSPDQDQLKAGGTTNASPDVGGTVNGNPNKEDLKVGGTTYAGPDVGGTVNGRPTENDLYVGGRAYAADV